MAKPKIAITGSSGLVGSRIVELLTNDFEFIPLSYEDGFDITNRDSVWGSLKDSNFDLLLHLAAYTNVDGAETEKEKARLINVEGTRNVFEVVNGRGKKMIYISTGFVFDGLNPPYFEDSEPNPTGYYGQTKYEGEKVLGNNAMIVRIDTPYRGNFPAKSDFVRTIKSLLEQKRELKMIFDALVTPTFIDDLSFALKYLFTNHSNEIFHIVGADSISPYNAAKLIAETFGLSGDLISQTTFEEYMKDKAMRPKLLDMKTKKNSFYKMRSFEEGLEAIK